MKIQCPKCAARYRLRTPVENNASVTVTCPNCRQRFSISAAETQQQPAKKILIVDDARFFRELILDLLAQGRFELKTANCGEDAWSLLQSSDFSLLIIDVNLPDISGLELIKRIRQDQRFVAIPILCISGVYRQSDDARQALMAGANDFMTKSFHPEDFAARVKRLLDT